MSADSSYGFTITSVRVLCESCGQDETFVEPDDANPFYNEIEEDAVEAFVKNGWDRIGQTWTCNECRYEQVIKAIKGGKR